MKTILACAALCVIAAAGWAEEAKAELTVRVDQIISRRFPELTVYAGVENEAGGTEAGLAPGLFGFRVDSLAAEGEWTVTPFSLREEPVDYSVLFSAGGIMEGEPLDFQKTALLQFTDGLKETDTLSVYAIGEEAVPLFEEKTKKEADTSLINGAAAEAGQPRLYDSLITVLRKAARRSARRKAVIVMSDGRDQGSRFTKEQLGAALAEAEIPVYAVGLRVLSTQSLSVLNELADSSGGSYIYARSLKDIPAGLKIISRRITQCYVIDMELTNIPADNLHHKLELTVEEQDASGRGAKTFIAVKNPLPRWVRWAILAGVLLCAIACVLLRIFTRARGRRRMGINRRRCPGCKRRMKDAWDECPFCKYLPPKKSEKKKAGGE